MAYALVLMLWTIVLILAIMWVLGMVTSTTLGGLLHLLLVVVLVIVVIQFVGGRRVG